MSSGFLAPTILWHVMEEGTATVSEIAKLSGCKRDALCTALHRMRILEQVQIAEIQSDGQHRYGLTRFGTEAALRVHLHLVEFSAANSSYKHLEEAQHHE